MEEPDVLREEEEALEEEELSSESDHVSVPSDAGNAPGLQRQPPEGGGPPLDANEHHLMTSGCRKKRSLALKWST